MKKVVKYITYCTALTQITVYLFRQRLGYELAIDIIMATIIINYNIINPLRKIYDGQQ